MGRIGSVDASFQTFALTILLHSAGVTSGGIYSACNLRGAMSPGGICYNLILRPSSRVG